MLLVACAVLCLQDPAPAADDEPDTVDAVDAVDTVDAVDAVDAVEVVDAAGVRAAAALIGLPLTDGEIEMMLDDVASNLRGYERLRARELDNAVFPALVFTPLVPPLAASPWTPPPFDRTWPAARRPDDLEELAFADLRTLAALVRTRQVTCAELVELSLARLERYDPTLHCVITLTAERAREQARALDAELDAGRWRGPLHGIPWGAKDLLAVRGHPTTWGAKPFADQTIDVDATVVERLDAAGAILVAKLSLGALAMGDVWFGERTRNPWDPERGSSGSSAGSASAVAAGCVPFAIGSETLGSIVSPSNECGTSALRPTFGRVSRHGAMALSWSMDKLGPICRSVDDAALVFDAIHGPDGRDPSVADVPFRVPGPCDVSGWRVGIPAGAFEGRGELWAHVTGELRALGVELVPVELPDYPVDAMRIILDAEAAAAFDELTRSGRDDELVRQDRRAWPNAFRVARLIPAVEYVRANRLRTLLCRDWAAALEGVDALVHPSFAGSILTATNLTGHPTVVAPCGFGERSGRPFSISFTGKLYDEARLLALAGAWQRATAYHLEHPELAPKDG